MTQNSMNVLNYLKNAGVGQKLTVKTVQEALGLPNPGSVTGSVSGLVRKGYAEWFKENVPDEDGNMRKQTFFFLTDAGAAFDPTAEA